MILVVSHFWVISVLPLGFVIFTDWRYSNVWFDGRVSAACNQVLVGASRKGDRFLVHTPFLFAVCFCKCNWQVSLRSESPFVEFAIVIFWWRVDDEFSENFCLYLGLLSFMIILYRSEHSLLCPDALVLNYVFQVFLFDSWRLFYGVCCICALAEPQYDTLVSSFKNLMRFSIWRWTLYSGLGVFVVSLYDEQNSQNGVSFARLFRWIFVHSLFFDAFGTLC